MMMMDNPDTTSSPWDSCADAFAPMYNEPISITHGGQRTTLRAAVFLAGTGDALVDEAMDTEREDITIVVAQTDWPYIQSLVRGDSVERPSGKRYRISAVECDEILGWCILARGV